jgi:hypothetical protein
MTDDSFLVDQRDPGLAMDAPVMNDFLFGIFIVIYVNKGHVAVVGPLKSLNNPVFVHAWGTVDRGAKEDKNGPVVIDGVREAFPVEVIGNVHGADITKPLSYLKNRIVADGGPAPFFWKGEKPVAGRQGARDKKREDCEKKTGSASRGKDLFEHVHRLLKLSETFGGTAELCLFL